MPSGSRCHQLILTGTRTARTSNFHLMEISFRSGSRRYPANFHLMEISVVVRPFVLQLFAQFRPVILTHA